MAENSKNNEVEVIELDIIEDGGKVTEVTPTTSVTVGELLKKNNELLEYHNKMMLKSQKMANMNIVVNMFFKLMLIPAALAICFFLYKVYEEMVVSNQKQMTIVNNLPQQETPVFNVNIPESKVEVREQTVLDKVSFYRGGFYGFVYKNSSENMIYCKTNEFDPVYDIVISPNSTLELTPEIKMCKDAELVEIKNPSAPKIVNKPYFEL